MRRGGPRSGPLPWLGWTRSAGSDRVAGVGRLRPRWRRFDRRAAVGCSFLAAAGFGLAAAGQYDDNRALIEDGVHVRATVVDAAGPLERTQWLALRFALPTGQIVVAPRIQDMRFDRRPDVGDQVDVVYDPDQPDRVVAAAATGPDPVPPYLLGGFAALFAVGGVASWRKLRVLREQKSP